MYIGLGRHHWNLHLAILRGRQLLCPPSRVAAYYSVPTSPQNQFSRTFRQLAGVHIITSLLERLERLVLAALRHSNPLMVATVPENEEPVRTMIAASIKKRKSMNALTTVLGFVLNFVCASSAVKPRSTNPANLLSSRASCEQFFAMALLRKAKRVVRASLLVIQNQLTWN